MNDATIKEGAGLTIAGLVTGLQLKRNKRGDLWAIATIEDLEGSVEVLFFPNAYVQFGTMLANDVVVAVRGRVSHRDESVSLIASDLTLSLIHISTTSSPSWSPGATR